MSSNHAPRQIVFPEAVRKKKEKNNWGKENSLTIKKLSCVISMLSSC